MLRYRISLRHDPKEGTHRYVRPDGTQTMRKNLASRVRMVAFSPTQASLGKG